MNALLLLDEELVSIDEIMDAEGVEVVTAEEFFMRAGVRIGDA